MKDLIFAALVGLGYCAFVVTASVPLALVLELVCWLWTKAFDRLLKQRDALHQFREWQKNRNEFERWMAEKTAKASKDETSERKEYLFDPKPSLRYDGILAATYAQMICRDCPRRLYREVSK